MALEDLTKKDLIELARKLDQTNKELAMKMEKVGAKAEELPYEAVSVVSTDDKHYSVRLKFDLESGFATVVEKTEYAKNMRHMAEYHAKTAFGAMSRIINNNRKE